MILKLLSRVSVDGVTNGITSPAYYLAEFLDRWFMYRVYFEPSHSVMNSVSLADTLKNVQLHPCSILCSFDIVGLFPNIPKAVTIRCLDELLVNSSVPHDGLGEFFDLLNMCWWLNFGKFDNKFSSSGHFLNPSFRMFLCLNLNLIYSPLAMCC